MYTFLNIYEKKIRTSPLRRIEKRIVYFWNSKLSHSRLVQKWKYHSKIFFGLFDMKKLNRFSELVSDCRPVLSSKGQLYLKSDGEGKKPQVLKSAWKGLDPLTSLLSRHLSTLYISIALYRELHDPNESKIIIFCV